MRNGSGKRCPRQDWECFDDRIEARAMAMDLSIKHENNMKKNHSSYGITVLVFWKTIVIIMVYDIFYHHDIVPEDLSETIDLTRYQ